MDDLLTIRDQRTMVDVDHPDNAHEDPDAVEQAWKAWADQHGFAMRLRDGDPSRELRRSRVALSAYIDGGAWYASCPRCNGGIAAWPAHDKGCCLDCGTIYPIVYPDEKTIAAATKALAVRPPELRAWFPASGETVADLERENVEHGYNASGDPSTTDEAALAGLVAITGNPERGRRALDLLRQEGMLK